MKKIILLILFSIFLFSNENTLFNSEESNSSKEAKKLISELKENPIIIEKKKTVKIHKRNFKQIEKDISADLNLVNNNLIDMKNIISNGFKNKLPFEKILKELEEIKISDFSDKYLRDLSVLKDSKVKDNLILKVNILKKKINEVKELKANLVQKIETRATLEETVVSKTKIDVYLSYLNNNYGKKYNKYLSYFYLDIGKLILFFGLMFLFIFMGLIFNYILNILFSILSRVQEDDDLENNDFNSIKKPMLFFFILIGFQLGLEVLVYPNILPLKLTLIFITLNTLNLFIISLKLVDIILYILSHKNIIKAKRTELINLLSRGFKLVIFLISLIFLFSKFGVDTTKIIASLGIGSLAIAFASKDMLSKFFAGIKLIIDDSFSIGDWVFFQFNGKEGTIIDVGFLNTTIRTFDNALLVIPNSKISEGSYINWSRRRIGRKIGMKLGVKYSSKEKDLKQCLIDLREMLKNHPGISPSNVNFSKKKVRDGKLVSIGDSLGLKNTLMVHLTKFADSGIEIDIYAFSKTVVWSEWRDVVEDIMFEVMRILEKNNLELAFPSQSIYIEKTE